MIEIKEISTTAGYLTVIIGLCALLWRYLVSPSVKLTQNVKRESKTIFESLPILRAIFQQWPLPSGPLSFIANFIRVDSLAQITHARLASVLDLIAVPVFECAPDGRCIHANRALCELFEMSPEAMIGQGWLEGVLPADRMPTHSAWNAAIVAGIPYEANYRVRGVESHKVTPCNAVASPLKATDGTIISYLGTVRICDDTEHAI